MEHPTGDCPVCKKPFKNGDDIVTCPLCGAPYHRECYRQAGNCVYADKHAAGFEYRPPAASSAAGGATGSAGGAQAAYNSQPHAAGTKRCPSCSAVNDSKNIFCQNCGTPLHGQAPRQPTGQTTGPGMFGYYGAMGVDMNGEVDGISKHDWAEYIGPSAPNYLLRLNQMKTLGRKVSFMFSAFFFGPAFLAYRKLWRWAALALAATLLLLAPQLLYMADAAGRPLLAIPTYTLEVASTVCSYISLALRFVLGMFALHLYRQDAGKKIKLIREQSGGDAAYHETLVRKGGTSVLGVVAVYAILFLMYLGVYLWAGDALLALLYPGLF